MKVKNSTPRQVCFTCYFVEGSQVQGCFVKYKCLRTNFNGNTTLEKTSVSDSNITKCLTGIHSGIYNVTFYDLDLNDMTYEDNYAVKLVSQSVNDLSSPCMIPTSSIPSTDVSSSTDVSPSPTMLCTNCTNSKLFYYYCYICSLITTAVGNNEGYLSLVIGGNKLLKLYI